MFGIDLGGLGNLSTLFKQAQELGGHMNTMAESLKQQHVTGSAGGGMVEVEINGTLEVLRCKIDPQVGDDRELLEDLLVAAMNQAIAKGKQLHLDMLKEKTSNMPLPGLRDALAKLNNLPADEHDK